MTQDETEATLRSHDGYEFSAEQNLTISRTGARARWWGLLVITFGALTGGVGLLALLQGTGFGVAAGVIYALLALVPFYIGLNFLRAGRSLQSVVTTKGDDVAHLMGAMGNLGTALSIQLVASSFWVVLLVLGIIAAITVPFMGDTRGAAYEAVQRSDLRNLAAMQEIYYIESGGAGGEYRYASSLSDLDFYLSDGVAITITSSGGAGWSARSSHAAVPDQECVIYFGDVPVPATSGGTTADEVGSPICD